MLAMARPSFGTDYADRRMDTQDPSLWNGLELLYAPILGSQGDRLFDFSGYGLHASVGGATYLIGGQGMSLLCDAGTEGVSITTPDRLKVARSSLVWYGRFISAPSANTPMFGVSNSNADASPYVGYILDVDGVGTGMRAAASRAGFIQVTTSTPLSTGVNYVTVGTYMPDSIKLYVNGIFRNENANVGSPSFLSTSQVLVGRHQSETSRVVNAQCYLAALYTRTLTAREVAQLSADPLILLRRRSTRTYSVLTSTTPQLARPIADLTIDNWETQVGGTTNLYQTLDETVADDADYIRTQLTPTNDVYTGSLGSVTDPVSSSGHTVRWRYGKDAAGGAAINLTLEYREGYMDEGSPGALIATLATLTDIPAGWTAGSYTLSGAEANAITAYGTPQIRLVGHCPIAPSNPAVVNSATTSGTTATTAPVVNLPASLVAGNLLMVLVRSAVAGAIGWPDASWVELFDASSDAADDQMALVYHTVTGTDGSTITLSSGNGKFAALAWQISGAEDVSVQPPELSTVAIGDATEPNATTVTPTGGSKTYLFGTIYGMAGEQTGITSYPTGYTTEQQFITSGTAAAVTTNVTVAGAWKPATAASDDAGVWDVTGTLAEWTAYSIAIHPKAPRRAQVSWLEFQVPEAPGGGGTTIMALERSLFRRVRGRVFSRVN